MATLFETFGKAEGYIRLISPVSRIGNDVPGNKFERSVVIGEFIRTYGYCERKAVFYVSGVIWLVEGWDFVLRVSLFQR